MIKIHVPDHEWRKQKRKQRLNNKRRDKKKSKIRYISQLDYNTSSCENDLKDFEEGSDKY